MTALEKRKEAWQWLQHQFPMAFPEKPIPLQVGVHEAILGLALSDMPKAMWIRRALRYYVNSPRYLREVVKDNSRINLQGEQSGFVSEEQAAYAKERLASYKAKRNNAQRESKVTIEPAKADTSDDNPAFWRRLTLKKKNVLHPAG